MNNLHYEFEYVKKKSLLQGVPIELNVRFINILIHLIRANPFILKMVILN